MKKTKSNDSDDDDTDEEKNKDVTEEKNDQTPGSPEGETGDPGGAGDDKNKETEKKTVSYETYLKVMDELKTAKGKVKTFETEAEKAKNQKLKDEGKIQELLDAANASNQKKDTILKKQSAKLVATLAGMQDPDDIIAHLDKFEFDEEFTITNADTVMKDLKENKAYLFKDAKPTVPATEDLPANLLKAGEKPFTLDQIKNMSDEDLLKNEKAIQEQMAAGLIK